MNKKFNKTTLQKAKFNTYTWSKEDRPSSL